MALSPYPVEKVPQEWALEHEEMGSKTKFWYRRPDGRSIWLFKYPHPGTGEHWAEKIAAEVARLIGIPHPVTRLAICGEERGSASRSFVRAREQLFHGNQEMAGALDWYDPTRRFLNLIIRSPTSTERSIRIFLNQRADRPLSRVLRITSC